MVRYERTLPKSHVWYIQQSHVWCIRDAPFFFIRSLFFFSLLWSLICNFFPSHKRALWTHPTIISWMIRQAISCRVHPWCTIFFKFSNTINSCLNITDFASMGVLFSSPWLPTTAFLFSITLNVATFFIMLGKIRNIDFHLRPSPFAYNLIIYIASGNFQRMMPIILYAGRRSNGSSQNNTC